MARKVQPWQPTIVKRFVRALPTSACTALVETDQGKAYLKAIGSDEGPHTLACDLIGTQLAKWFGLSTADFAIIDLTESDAIPFHNGRQAQIGPAFASRAVVGEPWGGNADQLKLLVNPNDISRLVVFDTWTLNCDRHSWPSDGKIGRARINRNNVLLSEEAPPGQLLLKAIDHTHCFSCGHELSRRLSDLDRIKDERVFGCFPEFRVWLDRPLVVRAANDLRKIRRSEVERMIGGIPNEWGVSAQAKEALGKLIVDRAQFVADTIEMRLWPQPEFDFEGGKAEEPSS